MSIRKGPAAAMILKLRVSHLFYPATLASGMGIGLLLGACSMSFPLQGFVDSSPTGSIKGGASTSLLSSSLDREDLRRANAALAVALDPQGNGTDVAWANPETGAGGSFVALAPAFPHQDGICRSFAGRVIIRARQSRTLKGAACRVAGGDWSVASIDDPK